MKHFIRNLQSQDVAAVVSMEEMLFDYPTDREGVETFMRKPCFGFVAAYQTSWQAERLAGYLLGEYREKTIRVHRFATHQDHRRKNVATSLFGVAMDLMNDRHQKLICDIEEVNMPACLLMKSLGFEARLVRGMYNQGMDGIRFSIKNAVTA